MTKLTRRAWLQQSALHSAALAAAGTGLFSPFERGSEAVAQAPPEERLPVAGVVTEYRQNSHADVILGKILEGFDQRGGPGPGLRLASLYVDQRPANDLSAGLAERFGFRLARTIDEALTLGTDRLQVAGVLSIGEHGNYPYTEDTHQHMYPRRRFFEEIVAAYRRCGAVRPLFNDKHLAYRWSDAEFMARTAREMRIPFMAGSSVPVAWRDPPTVLPIGCEIEDAVAVGYGGSESYGFHALEMLQCLMERRRGGETGVAAVQAVEGPGIWEAQRQGKWSRPLLDAALAVQPNLRPGPLEERLRPNAAFYLLEYRDGLKATCAMCQGVAGQFSCAVKLKGRDEPIAALFRLEEERPFGHFSYLVRAIERMIRTGRPTYPVERTVLTTGILDRAMHSLVGNHARLETPELNIRYEPVEWPFANQPAANE